VQILVHSDAAGGIWRASRENEHCNSENEESNTDFAVVGDELSEIAGKGFHIIPPKKD
jgi:hypothetical protein